MKAKDIIILILTAPISVPAIIMSLIAIQMGMDFLLGPLEWFGLADLPWMDIGNNKIG